MPHAQLLGLAGCGRKRLLLLWAALDLVRTGGAGPAAVAAGSGVTVGELGPAAAAAVDVWGLLRLSLTAMEPPDQPGQQVSGATVEAIPQQTDERAAMLMHDVVQSGRAVLRCCLYTPHVPLFGHCLEQYRLALGRKSTAFVSACLPFLCDDVVFHWWRLCRILMMS